jgi:serine/threonine protein kinase
MRPGDRFGDYVIVATIGEGGMSVVYLASRVSDGMRVVVKELKEQYQFDRQLIDRFLRNAVILQELRHPHLARTFACTERNSKHYMIQEYLSGGSLAELLRNPGSYSESEALIWCRDALRAMNYAHENGIVHGDLKPSNLMLDDRRQIRVIDFGIGRSLDEARLTRTNDGTIGTIEYMSPEQIVSPDKVDHRTDVYSMGIVLYELLSGTVPFDGDTSFAVQEKVVRETPAPLRKLGPGITAMHPQSPGIDARLSKVVFRAIDKSADKRFGGCAEFALHLDRYLRSVSSLQRPVSVGSSLPMRLVNGARAIAGMLARRSKQATKTLEQTIKQPRERPPYPVLLGVSAPRQAKRGVTFTARFAAYVPQREDVVVNQLRQLDAIATEDSVQTVAGLPPSRGGGWLIGAPVTVRLSGAHLQVHPETQSFEWNGSVNLVSFLVSVPEAAPDVTTQLCFEAFIEAVPVAFIPVNLVIGSRPSVGNPSTVVARPLSSAFACYASKDAPVVALLLSALKRWDPDADVFMDCLDLAPNQNWRNELERVIPSKDWFLLFWSINASRSPWVAWELQHARSAKGVDWIRPMPIDDPETAPPPDFLRHLHFRDQYQLVREASRQREDSGR